MRLLIGIPAFNEEKTIQEVIKSTPKSIDGIRKINILVVDDGSEDATARIAHKAGAIVLRHLINRGLGGALKSIFDYAKRGNYDILVTYDADGQHKGSDIRELIQPIIQNKEDVVIGTRWKDRGNSPLSRFIVNYFANVITYLLFEIWSTDTQSGFRVFNKQAIQKIHIHSDGMEVSSEFFKEIYRNKLHFSEIPISTIYTDYSKSKGQKLDNAPEVLLKLLIRFLK